MYSGSILDQPCYNYCKRLPQFICVLFCKESSFQQLSSNLIKKARNLFLAHNNVIDGYLRTSRQRARISIVVVFELHSESKHHFDKRNVVGVKSNVLVLH